MYHTFDVKDIFWIYDPVRQTKSAKQKSMNVENTKRRWFGGCRCRGRRGEFVVVVVGVHYRIVLIGSLV